LRPCHIARLSPLLCGRACEDFPTDEILPNVARVLHVDIEQPLDRSVVDRLVLPHVFDDLLSTSLLVRE